MRTVILGAAMVFASTGSSAGPDMVRERVERNIRILRTIETCTEGYAATIAGSSMVYASYRMDPSPALITRATTGAMAITWKTPPVPLAVPPQGMDFVVMAGLYGQEPSGFAFHLSVNGTHRFTFVSSPAETWEVVGRDGGKLRFAAAARDKYGDVFGCLRISVPREWMQPGEPVEFSLAGGKANHNAWCMVFQAPDVVAYQRQLVENEAYCDLSFQESGGKTVLRLQGPSRWQDRELRVASGRGPVAEKRFDSRDGIAWAEMPIATDGIVAPLSITVGSEVILRLDSLFTPFKASHVYPQKLVSVSASMRDAGGWRVRYEATYHPALGSSLVELATLTGGRGTQHLMISTHQDIAWMDSPERCIADRDEKIITPLLEIMRTDPAYCFDLEDVLILREFLGRHPGRKGEIHGLLKEGRLTVGASFNQPYEDLCSGEMLVRQFIAGRRWVRKEFPGCDARTYWNPDVPGRTLQMAQVMRRAGVPYLSMSRFTKGLFTWHSPDGSSILAFSPGHYADFKARAEGAGFEQTAGYVALSAADWLRATRSVSPDIPLISMSDMSGPDRYDHLINAWGALGNIVQKDGSVTPLSLPPIRYSTMQTFLDRIAPSLHALPVIRGERPNIWLYIHGPTHHQAISAKREADFLLPAAETFSTVDALLTGSFSSYPQARLTEAWEAQLYPDHGWGGKNGEITDSTFQAKYESAKAAAREILTRSLASIAKHTRGASGTGQRIVVFNALSWARSGPVRITLHPGAGELPSGVELRDARNRSIPVQVDITARHPDKSIASADLLFIAEQVPSVGYASFSALASSSAPPPPSSPRRVDKLESPYYRVELAAGGIRQVFDKEHRAPLFDTGTFLGGELFTMQSVGEDAGEWTEPQQPTMEGFERTRTGGSAWQNVESGPVRDVVEARSVLQHATVLQRVILYRTIKRIDVEVSLLGWDGTPYREFRLAFPVRADRGTVAYEVPFGTVEVGTGEMQGAPGERYIQEASRIRPRAIQNWIGIDGARFGVTLSSSVAVWDYLDPTEPAAQRPLLQPVLLASRRSCHGEGPWYLQKGDHHFRFSITSHPPGRVNRHRRGVEANAPLLAVAAPLADTEAPLPATGSFVELDADNLVLSTMKKCEDDGTVIVRVFDSGGKGAVGHLSLFLPVGKAEETDLLEETGAALSCEDNRVALTVGPYAIHTMKLTPAR